MASTSSAYDELGPSHDSSDLASLQETEETPSWEPRYVRILVAYTTLFILSRSLSETYVHLSSLPLSAPLSTNVNSRISRFVLRPSHLPRPRLLPFHLSLPVLLRLPAAPICLLHGDVAEAWRLPVVSKSVRITCSPSAAACGTHAT